MASNQSNPVAAAYAKALLELATPQGKAEAIGQELVALGEAIKGTPTLRAFLVDPGISQGERAAFLERTLKGRVEPLLYNTLGVMNQKGRLREIAGLATEYRTMLDRQLGRIEVDVTVAQALDAQGLEEVRQRISGAFKKDAIVRQKVDESIIGGLVLQVGDKVIDASVRTQLARMRQELLEAAPQ